MTAEEILKSKRKDYLNSTGFRLDISDKVDKEIIECMQAYAAEQSKGLRLSLQVSQSDKARQAGRILTLEQQLQEANKLLRELVILHGTGQFDIGLDERIENHLNQERDEKGRNNKRAKSRR